MDNVEDRLLRCFSVIFPELDETSLCEATLTSVEGWDSVATVTLINVIEEEFGVQIELDDVDLMVSFEQCLNYLRTKNLAAR